MSGRRLVFLLGVLVTLSAVLLLAAPGLALRKAIVAQLFGPSMVRVQVYERSGQDWNLDRGVITQVNGTQVTLREADGRIQAIPIASTTKIVRRGRRLPPSSLARRWRVVVMWPVIGPAAFVDVGRVPRLPRAIVNQLFGPSMVRVQVHEKDGQDWNLDRGVITQMNGTQVTLREADGRIQAIPVASTTKVIRLGRRLPLSSLARRWRVVVMWPAIGPAASVDVEKIPRKSAAPA